MQNKIYMIYNYYSIDIYELKSSSFTLSLEIFTWIITAFLHADKKRLASDGWYYVSLVYLVRLITTQQKRTL